ncbi:MAG: hypothetical protein M3010_12070, partial [Candidatus Dormibacteraeota bacterium]|nr:hypothetical protein [Candidatus Dormibacteraeota bacterium]
MDDGLVLAAYGVATLAFTWPLAAHLGDAVVSGIDPWQAVWNFWAVAGRLAAGRSPFHTDLLYYPQGADLYLHTLFPAVSVPLAPLTWLAGPLLAYNLAQLGAFVGTGYTMYLLCRDLGASRLGAFLAGFGLDFSAWHTVRLHGHLNLATIYWLPLYLLCLFRLARPAAGRARLVWPLLAGLMLALSALADYQQAVYLGLITVLWLWNGLLARRAAGAVKGRFLSGARGPLSPAGERAGVRGVAGRRERVGAGGLPPHPTLSPRGEGLLAALPQIPTAGVWGEIHRRWRRERLLAALPQIPTLESHSGEGQGERSAGDPA